MAILVDTNILLRCAQPHHPQARLAERAVSALRRRSEVLRVTAQNLVEFWAVATRPVDENGLGLTVEAAAEELAVLKRLFPLLPESASVFDKWERLVTTYRVSGKNAHDARIVAAMEVHGVNTILTFNVQDFARYKGVLAVHPEAVGGLVRE
jgi:predicted nucleic acid-binding protein